MDSLRNESGISLFRLMIECAPPNHHTNLLVRQVVSNESMGQ